VPLRAYTQEGRVFLGGAAGPDTFADLGSPADDPPGPLVTIAVDGGVIAGWVADPSLRSVELQVGEGPPVLLALVDVDGQSGVRHGRGRPAGTPFTVTTPQG
jgi:hypothetical protein